MTRTISLAMIAAVSLLASTPAAAEVRDDGPAVHLGVLPPIATILPGVSSAAISAPLAQAGTADPVDVQVDGVLKTVPAPAPGSVLALILGVLSIALPLGFNAFRLWRKDKADAELNAGYALSRTAFLMTEEAKRMMPDKIPDAALYAEAKFLELYRAQLKKDPSPDTLVLARGEFKALHGVTKIHEELAAASGPVAIVGQTASPQ